MEKQDIYISWSGGKDSTASIILAHLDNLPVKGVIMSEVMFSNEENISGEYPEHIKWVNEDAIPYIENKMGFPVIRLKSDKDYLDLFNHRITRSKNPDRIGKKNGFVIPSMCAVCSYLKMGPIRRWRKEHVNYIEIVGIAANERERLERLFAQPNKLSLLYKHNMTERGALELCDKWGLLSPTYVNKKRGGCWFCPNNNLKLLNENHPELIKKLILLEKDPDLVYPYFARGKSVEELIK